MKITGRNGDCIREQLCHDPDYAIRMECWCQQVNRLVSKERPFRQKRKSVKLLRHQNAQDWLNAMMEDVCVRGVEAGTAAVRR